MRCVKDTPLLLFQDGKRVLDSKFGEIVVLLSPRVIL